MTAGQRDVGVAAEAEPREGVAPPHVDRRLRRGRLRDRDARRRDAGDAAERGLGPDPLSGAKFKSSVTGGLAADTFFGPFFVGGSLGDGGAVRAYVMVGRFVR